ncbi:MAG: DUF4249 family protein [Calditrichia bacterium]|nr:DUF4249 family protein [Calditrichia bacterium]
MKKFAYSFILIFTTLLLSSCGKTSVTIDERTYEPNIVINGYLYPEKPVSNIQITRNFPIGTTIDKNQIALSEASVNLTDIETNIVYELTYNPNTFAYEYIKEDLEIDYGKSYRLDISANIDNSDLQASSTTTVPEKGLEIDRENSIFGDLFYRETDETGKLITPQVAYKQSENSAFYLLSISALNADIHTFIYENPFGLDINDVLEEDGKIENFQYRVRWTRPENQNGGFSIMEISWFQIWFYGPYRLVLYAGDENFYHFYNTHRNVQNIDGNLHEPIFHIDGDGIGVFGSAVIDTLSLNILKK